MKECKVPPMSLPGRRVLCNPSSCTGLWMLLLLLANTTTVESYSLRVQFDGSLRLPDNDSLGRVGTAAACISITTTRMLTPKNHVNYDNDDRSTTTTTTTEVMWLGGRSLDPAMVETSAHAEYQGLLLGLTKTLDVIQQQQLLVPSNNMAQLETLVIQGDCKTVMDQLQQSSRPRKLEQQYQQAQALLEQLQRQLQQRDNRVNVQFRHVPRDRNQLCDGLCQVIRRDIIEIEAQQTARRAIQQAASSHDLSTILSLHLAHRDCVIPYHQRPALFHLLAQKALDLSDYWTLIQIGEHLQHLGSKRYRSSSKSESSSSSSSSSSSNNNSNITEEEEDAKLLQAQGIAYQIQALQQMATPKSLRAAVAMKRKHRYLLLQQHQESLSSSTASQLPQLVVQEPTPTVPTCCSHAAANERQLQIPTTATPPSGYQGLWNAWLKQAPSSEQWQQEQCFWMEVSQPELQLLGLSGS